MIFLHKKKYIQYIYIIIILFYSKNIHANYIKQIEKLQKNLDLIEQLAIYTPMGDAVFHHGKDLFIPASILKIFTSFAALDMLGEQYQFTTPIFSKQHNNRTELVIQGRGDPFFVSEQIDILAKELTKRGFTRFHTLTLDNSLLHWGLAPGAKKSTNPYDAPHGALIVNFNTIHITKNANGTVYSGEKQTPLTPFARTLGKSIAKSSTHRFNIGNNQHIALGYSHELIQAIFAHNGIYFSDKKTYVIYSEKKYHKQSKRKLLYTFSNRQDINKTIRGLLKYSNNFTANQLGLLIALEHGASLPVNIESAIGIVRTHMYNKLKLDAQELYFDEFSGLSRNNRVSMAAMRTILLHFMPYAHLLDEHAPNVFAKTGTLQGISNLAGYIYTSKGNYPFIIHTYNIQKRELLLSLLQSVVQAHQI